MRVSHMVSLLLVLAVAAQTSAVLLTGALAGGLGLSTGLAGLIGLKLVALKAGLIGGYLGSRKFGRSKSYHAPSYGHGGYGHAPSYGHGGYGNAPSYGHGGHGHGYGGHDSYSSGHSSSYSTYHRRRRDVIEQTPLPLEQYFEMVAAADVLGCGRRLVCELEAADYSLLADDETLILALFSHTLAAPSEATLARSAKASYDLAALTGRLDGVAACRARHSSCQYNRQQMMQMLRTVDPQ